MLDTAIQIAREAGCLLAGHFGGELKVNAAEKHDVKLELDVRCQRLIEERLAAAFPAHSIVGEEESRGRPDAEWRWIVDPLDGTVNFSRAIPHYAVSIALQRRIGGRGDHEGYDGYATQLGVVFDPSRNEMFAATRGGGAFLNGRPIRAATRADLGTCIVSVGFSKSGISIDQGVRLYSHLVRNALKIRTMGSAALDLAYVASGRLDAYLEYKVKLWDLAAGALLVAEAGGSADLRPALSGDPHTFCSLTTNGALDLRAEFEAHLPKG
ncbi:MAG: inositol monophosphatase [Verrucomicrobiae bacterium]|nr:inositol monophosphatase [Verrucomicrobiae bacterium]